MSDYSEFVRSAAGVFSELYPTPQATRRLLDSAGVDSLRVDLSDPALHRWLEILKQAVDADELDALLAAALREHPAHTGLRALSERRSTAYSPPPASPARPNSAFPGRPMPPATRSPAPFPAPSLQPHTRRSIDLPPVSRQMPAPDQPASALPTTEARAQLRLDVGVPETVVAGRSFDLAVSVRNPASPVLFDADLRRTGSAPFWVRARRTRPWVRLRIDVSAPECDIADDESATFTLWFGQDSPVFLWHLTPRQPGEISIIVRVFEVKDWLGSARVHTQALAGQPSGAVRMVVSALPLASPDLTLAKALLRCPSVKNRQKWDAIVGDLPEPVLLAADRSDNPLVDVQNVIAASLNYEGGLDALIAAVRSYEGPSLPMRAVDQLLEQTLHNA